MVETVGSDGNETYDVAVIGGGAAGLSGAIILGRSRRKVIVIDGGTPRNAPADGVHGFLGHDGRSPLELLARGREEAERYDVRIRNGEALEARRTDHGFEIDLTDGQVVNARRLLVTTGLVDDLPDLPGVRERWGRDVIHCPFCHGYEARDQPVGILATTDRAVHQAMLFRQLTPDVIVFTHTAPALSDEAVEELAACEIKTIDGTVQRLEIVDDKITGVRMADGSIVPRSAIVVAPRMLARSSVLTSLGITVVEHPMGVGEYVPAGPMGLTDVPGVWVAGNVTNLMAQVVTAAAAGSAAGAAIHADLINEETRQAVLRYRESATVELRSA